MENQKQKNNITFEDFLKLDVRVCEIISSERVPKTDKLLKLVINTGFDERVAVTNLGAQFDAEHFVGLNLPFVLNLEPVTMKGIESTAMILACSEGDNVNLFHTLANAGAIVI